MLFNYLLLFICIGSLSADVRSYNVHGVFRLRMLAAAVVAAMAVTAIAMGISVAELRTMIEQHVGGIGGGV